MGIEKQGGKPTGVIGIIIGRLMNEFHTKNYVKYFKNNMPAKKSHILDIGCGGGKFLKFMAESDSSYMLTGLDHSEKMIQLSSKINRKLINEKRVRIIHGSVIEIPLEDNTLDMVTAFETVNFWPDINKSFSEILRVLKPGGKFLIINLYPKEGTKWWKLAKMKSDKEFETTFNKAGFKNASTDLNYKKGWIIAKGVK